MNSMESRIQACLIRFTTQTWTGSHRDCEKYRKTELQRGSIKISTTRVGCNQGGVRVGSEEEGERHSFSTEIYPSLVPCANNSGKISEFFLAISFGCFAASRVFVPDDAEVLSFFAGENIEVAVAVEILQFDEIELDAVGATADRKRLPVGGACHFS